MFSMLALDTGRPNLISLLFLCAVTTKLFIKLYLKNFHYLTGGKLHIEKLLHLHFLYIRYIEYMRSKKCCFFVFLPKRCVERFV